MGTAVEPEIVARVLAHPRGGLKNKPARARAIPLINKAQNVAQLLLARDNAHQLLGYEGIEAVAFVPLLAKGRLIGKFVTYYDARHFFSDHEFTVAMNIAGQLAHAWGLAALLASLVTSY